jgi:hypothetical protein
MAQPTKPPIVPKDNFRPWAPGELRRPSSGGPYASAAKQIWDRLPSAVRPEVANTERPEKGKR